MGFIRRTPINSIFDGYGKRFHNIFFFRAVQFYRCLTVHHTYSLFLYINIIFKIKRLHIYTYIYVYDDIYIAAITSYERFSAEVPTFEISFHPSPLSRLDLIYILYIGYSWG